MSLPLSEPASAAPIEGRGRQSDSAKLFSADETIEVDEAKKAEDRLRRSETWLAQAQRLSHTGTWVLDGTTRRFLYWSDESYRIWGFDPLQGLPSRDDMWERIHPDDRERVWGEVQEALRGKRDFRAEFRILLPDETVKYLEAKTHHEFSPLGALLEVICTNVDVTERKYAEQALRESERKHRQLIESVPFHFWSVTPNGEPICVNQRLRDYFGNRFEDRKRDMEVLQEVLHPDDVAETARALNHAFQTGEPFQREHRLRRADGEYRWHRVRAEPQRDPKGQIVQWFGLSVDIDERKRSEERLCLQHTIAQILAEAAAIEEAKLDQLFFRYPHRFGRRELAELIWTASHQNVLELLAAVPARRQHRVVYEELVASPEAVLRGLCAALGIAFHPDMAEPYKEGARRMTDGIHKESRMLGDVKFHRHTGVDPASAWHWRQSYSEDFLGEVIRHRDVRDGAVDRTGVDVLVVQELRERLGGRGLADRVGPSMVMM